MQLETSPDGKLNIVQGFSKHGDNQLRSQRIDVWLWFTGYSNMVLKGVMVNKAERTEDILSQMSPEV